MDISLLKSNFENLVSGITKWVFSPQFYTQFTLILLSFIIAYSFAYFLKRYAPMLRQAPSTGPWLTLKSGIYNSADLLFPLFTIIALDIAIELSNFAVKQTLLVQIGQGMTIVFLMFLFITRYIKSLFIQFVFKWFLIPIAILHVLGWLDNIVVYLESISLAIGNIKISAYGLVRVFIFGSILFWVGRISNRTGQNIIRKQEKIDFDTREIFAKLFEVILFIVIFILLLQIMGINLTALAVFGGALGVGLGFGLQAIASNFISGLMILIDRSIRIGDFIELEDGRSGMLREMNMRSSTLETFDGKDIMVPNEQFITTRFINWTRKNKKQRYSLEFQVSYKTDLPEMLKLVKNVIRTHPQVLSDPDLPIEELPDAEISGFGESGVDILVEFWMEGIDDGKNRVGADLLMMIWEAFKENGIEIPYPKRDVTILNPKST